MTITTEPRQACTLTVSIAKRRFSHKMPYGWIQVKIPRRDSPGRVPVKVNCSGHVVHSAFRVKR